jgi:hypothetical protein
VPQREGEGILDERLVDFDDAEGGPFRAHHPHRGRTRSKAYRTSCLEEANAANEPPICSPHQSADEIAPRLRDVALDQRARVDVKIQSPASRSARINADALRTVFNSRGGLRGRPAAGGVRRPSATSSRTRSALGEAPAGTMSATALPRTVTLICSPWSTARRTWLRLAFRSRTPIVRM